MYQGLEDCIDPQRRDEIFSAAAKKIVEKKLQTVAVLFLEMNKPLSLIAHTATVITMPFFAPVIGLERLTELAQILRERKNIDLFISKIEEEAGRSEERDSGTS